MTEINYIKEKCWQIKEVLPIKVSKVKNRHQHWDLVFPKMTITYDTFLKINNSITHLECYSCYYDYTDGSCALYLKNKGLKELEEKFSDIIIIL